MKRSRATMGFRRSGQVGAARLLVLIGVPVVLAAVGGWVWRTRAVADRPNIVLVILDTVRADSLGCYGSSRPVTPAMDAIAKEGVRFDQAISSSCWTLPAVASILTGVHPTIHGAFGKKVTGIRCREDVPRGAELLRKAGMRTKAFVNAVFLHPELGLDIGFEDYDFFVSTNRFIRRSDETVRDALAYFKAHRRDRAFTMIHLFDPHLDYDPPGMWATKFTEGRTEPMPPLASKQIGKRLLAPGESPPSEADQKYFRAVYDGDVGFVDSQLQVLVDGLRALGMWDRTTLIVTADHGEEFWDHGGFEHGHTMYDELIRVPLVVKLPKKYGVARSVVKSQVRTMDLMPTIFEVGGVAAPAEFDGQSLLPTMVGAEEPKDRVAFSEGTLYWADKVSWRTGEYKYIHDLGGRGDELYRLASDPGERTNLISSEPETARRLSAEMMEMQNRLKVRASTLSATEAVEVGSKLKEAMKSTGYVGGGD